MTYEEVVENINNKKYEVVNHKSERDFFEDLCELYQLDANKPLTKRMYSKAWDGGHYAGYHEVLNHFSGLVEVFRDE